MDLVDFNARLDPRSASKDRLVRHTAELVNGDSERIPLDKETRIASHPLQEPCTAARLASRAIEDLSEVLRCPVRILSISDHEDLRLSRELLLKSAGYNVVSTTSDLALREAVPEVQIVIIGHSVKERSASRLISAFRQARPKMRIMRVTGQSVRAETGCDASCFLEDGPAEFLRCLADLIDKGHAKDRRD